MADTDQQLTRPSRKRRKEQSTEPLAVVGVGVCAASLRSLEQLFGNLKPEIGAAYLVGVRQQEGLGVAEVVEALRRQSPFGVKLAADGERLEPNHIYVGGPDDMITLEDGHVHTRPAQEPIAHRGTIDSMLISLAEHAHDRAVAVILTGLGADGTAGVTATKKFGGLSIAESTAHDEDATAQGAAGPAGIVDLLLPIGEIPGQIALYVANLDTVGDAASPEDIPEQVEGQITQVATILRNVTGHDFHGYKRNTFLRRIHRRMQVTQADGIDAYVARMRGDREEVQNLFQDLLIGVTQFFRDPQEFDLLEGELPRLFEGKGADDQLRVWVLGCATGEEAYSIGILLREHLATLDNPPHVQIFATDLDARALAVARSGRYADSAVTGHVRPDRLARWFVKEGDTYCVSKELREMCIFSPHNLVKDAPFSRIDLLSCRNLLIYLNADLQNRVIPIFHFALRPGGVLFLGSSENITRHQNLFAPIDRKNRVFRRLDTATRVLPDFPLTPRAWTIEGEPTASPPMPRAAPLSGTVGRRAEQVAESYAPAYVVVDAQNEVLHFSGRTGGYLEPAAGAATLNLLSLVHRDLRLDLRSALHRAGTEARRIETTRVPIYRDGQTVGVNIIVEPLNGDDATTFVILFQDSGPLDDSVLPDGERIVSDEHVQRLESELRLTKERLQATIEELESTNEELKSSNEEYQSINEELQSANEELETSKEELQSVNEELQTVNGELGHRVGELGRTNSDLKNLLESTQIATLFLDNDLRVRNFTPAATDIFHLLETDIGRPIDHVAGRVSYPEMQEDVRKVIKTLVPVERELGGADDQHFTVRVLPYRSVDNFIAGAVVTFLDVTFTVRAEAALRESEERYRRLFESIDQGFCIIEVEFDADRKPVDYRFLEVNPAFERQTGLGNATGKSMRALAPGHEEYWFETYGHVALTGEPASFEHRAEALGSRWYEVFAFRIGNAEQRRVAVLFNDISARKQTEDLQQTLIAELQHRTRNLLAVVRSIAQQTLRASTSLEEFGREFGDRLAALSRVQGLLSRGDGFTATLEDLVRGELQAHGAMAGDGKITIHGPSVALSSREVQVLTLALHELATNAIKYGALAQPEGKLSVLWSISSAGERRVAAIEWIESGVQLDGRNTAKSGFGRELIERALPYDLGAETSFEFRADGIHCDIRVPLETPLALAEPPNDPPSAA